MFKFFIFAVFLYVIYRLLTGDRKRKVNQSNARQAAEADTLAHDQLVEDPVCHIYVPKRQALMLQDKDATVFFCSEQCRKMYVEAQK